MRKGIPVQTSVKEATRMKIGIGRCEMEFPAGFFPTEGFVKQAHPLHVRVFFIDEETPFALVSIEMTSLSDEECARIKKETAILLGIGKNQVWVAATHTFSAPHILPDFALKTEEEKEKFNITDSTPVWIIYTVINVIFLIPNITVSVRRLHDVNRSGWFYLLNLIPFIGSLILLYFYLQDSFPDSNEYGPSTKYILPVNDFSRNPLVNNNEKEMQEIP